MKLLEKIIEYGLYLFIFLLPWQTRWMWHLGELNKEYWEYGTMSLYMTDIVLIGLLVLGIVWYFKETRYKVQDMRNKIRKMSNIWYLISGILLISFLSIYWAPQKSLGLYASFKLLEGIGLFVLVSKIKFNWLKLAWLFVGSATLQSILAIWQFSRQSVFSSKWLGMAAQSPEILGASVVENSFGRWLRAYGSLPHPNILAGFLVIGLLILIGLFLNHELRIKNHEFKNKFFNNLIVKQFIIFVCYALLLSALFFTFSRGAWIGFLFGFLGLLFFGFKKNLRVSQLASLLAVTLITIIVLSSIFWPILSTRLMGAERLEIKSTEERITSYKEAAVLIKRDWHKGVGIGNYTLGIHNQVNPHLRSWAYQPVHNVYLLVFAELGIVGLIVWLLLIGTVFYRIIRFRVSEIRYKSWFFVFSSILGSIFVIFFFDHYFWTLHFGIMLFWLCLGLWSKQVSLL